MIRKIDKSFIIITFIMILVYALKYLITGSGINCIFYEITGLYCPGCGITRMFFSIFNLDFAKAFRYNSLVFILLILYIIYFILKYIFKRKIEISKKVYITLLIIVILFGVLRNIPFFSILAPL